jgi:hypothetical protein
VAAPLKTTLAIVGPVEVIETMIKPVATRSVSPTIGK